MNFALDPWLNLAEHVNSCKCVRDSVQINMKEFKRRLNGEPSTSEYESYDEADLQDNNNNYQLLNENSLNLS